MITTLSTQNGIQTIQIPQELQFAEPSQYYEILKVGNALLIRPVHKHSSLTDLLSCFAAFSPDFLADGRPSQDTQERESL